MIFILLLNIVAYTGAAIKLSIVCNSVCHPVEKSIMSYMGKILLWEHEITQNNFFHFENNFQQTEPSLECQLQKRALKKPGEHTGCDGKKKNITNDDIFLLFYRIIIAIQCYLFFVIPPTFPPEDSSVVILYQTAQQFEPPPPFNPKD